MLSRDHINSDIQTPFIHTNYAEISNAGDTIISSKRNIYFRISNFGRELKRNFKIFIINFFNI